MKNHDPRLGLPSASSMHRLAQCPGSVALSNSLRAEGKLYECRDPDAQSGTRIHQWLAGEFIGGEPVALDARELPVALKCAQLREARIKEWLSRQYMSSSLEILVEKRLWYRQGLDRIFSGQADYVCLDHANKRALVIDYKTGRLEADAAADNLQLRALVVLLKHNWPFLTEISATIIEPWVSWESEFVVYSGEALEEAQNQILSYVDLARWAPQVRFAGPHCKHCPARAHCQEAIDFALSLSESERDDKGLIILPRGEPGVALWEKIKVAKKLLKGLEEAYERILENEPEALPGYIMPPQGRERRIVAYPAKLKAALAPYLSSEEIDGCAEFHLAKIEELLGLKHKLAGKALERTFGEATQDVVAIVHDKPFIRPLTKREREALEKAKLFANPTETQPALTE